MIASRVLAAELSRLGFAITSAECRQRYTGKRMRDVLAEVENAGIEVPEDFLAQLKERDMAAFKNGLTALPGAERMLKELPHRRCVASSGSMEKMSFTLGHTGLLPYLKDHLFSAARVQHGKPAPDLFLLAAQEMGASPQDCVVVEDSTAGVKAGRAAGMRVLGFVGGAHVKEDPGYGNRLCQEGADAVFDHLPEIMRYL